MSNHSSHNEFIDPDDSPEEIIRVFREAILSDYRSVVLKPWSAFAIVINFRPGVVTRHAPKFDGIVCTPGDREKRENIAFSYKLPERLQQAMKSPDLGLFNCWTTLYNGQTGIWKDYFYWGNDENPWMACSFMLDNEFLAKQNPVDPNKLEVPFSSESAAQIFARFRRKNKISQPPFKRSDYQSDRLSGGYRLYTRTDRDRGIYPLESIEGALQNTVGLVADNLEVEITDSPIEQHQAILDELNARHPVPEPGLWVA